MIIVYGYRTLYKREGQLDYALCQNCSHNAPQTLCRYIKQFTLFGVPIVSRTNKRGIMCESCGNILPLSNDEYKSLKKQCLMTQ